LLYRFSTSVALAPFAVFCLTKNTWSFSEISSNRSFIKDQKSGDHIFVHMKDLLDEISEKDQVFFVKQKTAKGAKATLVEKR
jgi:cold shock CspA family protein